jgi:hypothetical protein
MAKFRCLYCVGEVEGRICNDFTDSLEPYISEEHTNPVCVDFYLTDPYGPLAPTYRYTPPGSTSLDGDWKWIRKQNRHIEKLAQARAQKKT